MGFNPARTKNMTPDVSGSLALFSVLGVAFIILKLCKVVAWSWWWVLAPFWGWPIVAVLLVLIAFIMVGYGLDR